MSAVYASVAGTAVIIFKDKLHLCDYPKDVRLVVKRRGEEVNLRPYNERGWCVFEQGIAQVVAAHVDRTKHLPHRLMQAEAAIPKVTHICVERDMRYDASTQVPTKLLKQLIMRLQHIKFTSGGDKRMVIESLKDFEWCVNSSMEQAAMEQSGVMDRAALRRQVTFSSSQRLASQDTMQSETAEEEGTLALASSSSHEFSGPKQTNAESHEPPLSLGPLEC